MTTPNQNKFAPHSEGEQHWNGCVRLTINFIRKRIAKKKMTNPYLHFISSLIVDPFHSIVITPSPQPLSLPTSIHLAHSNPFESFSHSHLLRSFHSIAQWLSRYWRNAPLGHKIIRAIQMEVSIPPAGLKRGGEAEGGGWWGKGKTLFGPLLCKWRFNELLIVLLRFPVPPLTHPPLFYHLSSMPCLKCTVLLQLQLLLLLPLPQVVVSKSLPHFSFDCN